VLLGRWADCPTGVDPEGVGNVVSVAKRVRTTWRGRGPTVGKRRFTETSTRRVEYGEPTPKNWAIKQSKEVTGSKIRRADCGGGKKRGRDARHDETRAPWNVRFSARKKKRGGRPYRRYEIDSCENSFSGTRGEATSLKLIGCQVGGNVTGDPLGGKGD